MQQTPKRYLHDRLVLLLLTINTFLTLLGSLLILLRLDSRVNGYIIEYRASRGISAFKTGGKASLIAFIVFMFIILGLNTLIGLRGYHLHRQYGLSILALGTLLVLLSIIVSNALLVLR